MSEADWSVHGHVVFSVFILSISSHKTSNICLFLWPEFWRGDYIYCSNGFLAGVSCNQLG